jgi:hypothetical protein
VLRLVEDDTAALRLKPSDGGALLASGDWQRGGRLAGLNSGGEYNVVEALPMPVVSLDRLE